MIAFTDTGEPPAYKANVLDKAIQAIKKYQPPCCCRAR